MKTDSIPVGSGISQLGHKLSEFLKSTNITLKTIRILPDKENNNIDVKLCKTNTVKTKEVKKRNTLWSAGAKYLTEFRMAHKTTDFLGPDATPPNYH